MDGKWVEVAEFSSIAEERRFQKRSGSTMMHEFLRCG